MTRLVSLLESKDHLIDKLDLTDEQKERLKAFFKKYPTSESKIDWNRKDLAWEDFADLLDNEGKSKSQAKKYGLSGLKEGTDYLIIDKGEDYTIYYPLNFKASETLANSKVEPKGVTGKWCIAGGNYGPDNDDKYWKRYTVQEGYDFFFVFTDMCKYAIARHFANAYNAHTRTINEADLGFTIFDSEDHQATTINSSANWYYFGSFRDKDNKNIFVTTPGYLYEVRYKWDGPFLYKNMNDPDDPKWALTGYDSGIYEKNVNEKYSNYHILPGTYKISRDALTNCDDLFEIYIPSTVTFIGTETFNSCRNLTKVVFENDNPQLEFLENETFYQNFSLQEVQLPDSLEVIQNEVFFGCQSLKKITFPKNLMAIGSRAFCGSGLEQVILPEGLSSIVNQTFAAMRDLEYVRLPSSIDSLGTEIFKNSKNLKQIDFMGTQAEWDKLIQQSNKSVSRNFWDDSNPVRIINALTGLAEGCKINILGKENVSI